MNWDTFSTIGYFSVAVWALVPLLWIGHVLRRPRGWLVHAALVAGVAAFVLAVVNSKTHVNRIRRDPAQRQAELEARRAKARKERAEARAKEAAQIRFAEDGAGEHLDTAGMDEADLAYLRGEDEVPEWKKEKKERSRGGEDDDSLEALIGGIEEEESLDTGALESEVEAGTPILMSDADYDAAHRLDAANLAVTRLLLALAAVVVVVDYLRRANRYEDAYWPLPLPGAWRDAWTPLPTARVFPDRPRRTMAEELAVLARRGESFIYLTDSTAAAAEIPDRLYRLPPRLWPVEVMRVADSAPLPDDDFIFESLWYGRASFVVDSATRAEALLARFVQRLAERRTTRARVRQTVHVVWDLRRPMPDVLRAKLVKLAERTGWSVLVPAQ
jgi:hypothetical protein